MINRPLFTDGSIKLTALDPEEDAGVLSRWTNSPSFVSHYFDGFFRPYKVDEVKKKLKDVLKKASESNARYIFAVREADSRKLFGLVKIGYISGSNQSTQLFLDLMEEESFEQYAGSVLAMVLRYIFMELSLHRVSVRIPSYDEKALSLFEGAGFLRETQRRQAIYHDGCFHDELVYGLLRPDWKKAQEVQE
jgi:RimJ/RimL family protein N-acetyltransferase